MTPLLSRTEAARILDLDLTVVDALIESGRLLCHVRRGETRIPLQQLEAFLRDSLVRLYRAEAGAAEDAPPRSVGLRPPSDPSPPSAGLRPTSDPAPPPPEGRPEAYTAPAEPEPERPPIILASPAPAPSIRPADEPRPELRVAERYVPLRQIDGIFGETKCSMLQLSSTGLRIKHREPLLPGTEAKLSFALLKTARSVVVRARVVWTSIARAGDERFSISGLRVLDHQERLSRAIDLLRSTNELQPERRTQVRRATDGLLAIEDISDEDIALVTNAIHKFAADPVEAGRWYSRARFAVADENVRRAAPERPREREEVLGIWEYLDRQVDIPKIAGIVGWLRQGAPAQ